MNRGIDILGKDSAELVHFGVWVFVCVDLWVCGLGNNDMNTSMLQKKGKMEDTMAFCNNCIRNGVSSNRFSQILNTCIDKRLKFYHSIL